MYDQAVVVQSLLEVSLTAAGGGGGLTSACCREGSAADIPAVQLVHEVGMNPSMAQLDDPAAISTEAGSSIAMWLPIDTICAGGGSGPDYY